VPLNDAPFVFISRVLATIEKKKKRTKRKKERKKGIDYFTCRSLCLASDSYF
jgi:hypothetical protein